MEPPPVTQTTVFGRLRSALGAAAGRRTQLIDSDHLFDRFLEEIPRRYAEYRAQLQRGRQVRLTGHWPHVVKTGQGRSRLVKTGLTGLTGQDRSRLVTSGYEWLQAGS